MKTTLTPSTDLKNTKVNGLGWEMLDSTAGAFVVLEECSHSAPYEIGRFEHDGSAKSRANAFREAQTLAGSRDKFNGEGMSFNTYEETADEAAAQIPAAVSELTAEEARTVSNTARLVRQDIRKKYTSLKALRVMKAEDCILNPYHADRRDRQLTPKLWELIRARIGDRVEVTCAALLDLEQRADQRNDQLKAEQAADRAQREEAAQAPLMVGDKINDGGVIRHITHLKAGGVIVVIDNITEAMAHSVQRIETRGQICARIMQACGISEDYALQALIGAKFNEEAAIAAVRRTQGYYRARHESADAEAAAFIVLTENEPAADVTRLTFPEVVARMQIERAQPCGTRPTSRGFIALQISQAIESGALHDDSDARDRFNIQLVNCLAYGVVTSKEYAHLYRMGEESKRPFDLLEALRGGLTRGVDLAQCIEYTAL